MNILISHNGAFNVFSTVVDSCHQEAFDEDEARGMFPDDRVDRAILTGSSSDVYTLDVVIGTNAAGKDGARMPKRKFIREFLTI